MGEKCEPPCCSNQANAGESNDAIETGGKVVKRLSVGSNRRAMLATGTLLEICMVPARGGAPGNNSVVNLAT